jgi:hypothetical protein
VAQTPEGKVKDKVKRILKKHRAWYYMPVSMGFGAHGIPDFIVCANGTFLGIETKAPGKRANVTALQNAQGQLIQQAGGAWMVVADPEDFLALEEWCHAANN